MEPLEFINELTILLQKNPAKGQILGVYMSNSVPEIHLMDSLFLQLFPTYSKDHWTAGTYDTKLIATINGCQIFTLTNLLPEEK